MNNSNLIRVFVYWNLTKKIWSVRNEKTGRIVTHLPELTIQNCTFVVSQAGRERVIREKSKNVHAGVRGYIDLENPVNQDLNIIQKLHCKVTYNPYIYKTFVNKDDINTPILKSSNVHMFSDRTLLAEL